jgi:uncharacterized protein involved in exopolysaccharide biosynthesis
MRFTPRIAAICAAIVVLSVASTTLAASQLPKRYGGRVDLLYLAPANAPLDARQRELATQQELLRSRAVLLPVAQATGVPLLRLERAVSVGSGANDILHLTVADRNRDTAVTLAQAVARQYLRIADGLAEATDPRSLQRQIDQVAAAARAAPPERAATLRERQGRLEDAMVQADATGAGGPTVRMLSRAYALESPLSPKPLRAAAVGMLWGLALAAGTAFVLTRRRRAGGP